MTTLRGMLTLAELAAEVAADEIDTVIIAFSDHYGRLMGKRLDAEYFLAEAAQGYQRPAAVGWVAHASLSPREGHPRA